MRERERVRETKSWGERKRREREGERKQVRGESGRYEREGREQVEKWGEKKRGAGGERVL